MRQQGKIVTWNDDRGFGFVAPSGGGKQVFIHITSFASRGRQPLENDIVLFELGTDANGRPRAEHTTFAGECLPRRTSSRTQSAALALACVFLVLLVGATFIGKLPILIPGLYFLASVVTFVAYAIDRSAARTGRWRTSESTLHWLGLIGGWPGAAAAQSLLRHKSSKRSFQFVFWMTVALNGGVLGWMLSPSGREMLRSAPFLTDFDVHFD